MTSDRKRKASIEGLIRTQTADSGTKLLTGRGSIPLYPAASRFHLTESVHKVVLQKSIPAHTRKLILYISNMTDTLKDLRGN